MKPELIGLLACCAALALAGAGCRAGAGAKPDPDLARLVEAKRAQAKELAAVQTNPVPVEVWHFFDAMQRDQWVRATNLFEDLSRLSGRASQSAPPTGLWSTLRSLLGQMAAQTAPALSTPLWCPIHETLGVGEVFHEWDLTLLHRYGRDIIGSIPTNSIYFGGTDPGRFAITALIESHQQARPFFVLTQNALADGRYLDYLRLMYGSRIYIPTSQDSQGAFQEYLQDAQRRLQAKELKPGEDVKIVNNRVQVSGQIAVMSINALLAKIIIEHNPDREIYLEESFPLDWMYPHLEPHGLIFKVNHQPLTELGEAAVREDHSYWTRCTGRLMGDWLREETSVKEVCDFSDRVFLQKNLSGFQGDRAFVGNAAAHKAFSKLRSSVAGLYAWRAEHASSDADKQRMRQEADFAFRQALALCPYLPEAVFRYANLLLIEGRKEDALLIAQTAQKLDASNGQVRDLVEQLKKQR